jgi:hypothetical protein
MLKTRNGRVSFLEMDGTMIGEGGKELMAPRSISDDSKL